MSISKIRMALAIVLLVISLALLGWSLWPARRATRIQHLEPTQMQLPTPEGALPGTCMRSPWGDLA